METTYLVVFSIVAGAFLLLATVITLFGASTLKGLRGDLDDLAVQMNTQIPPKQLEQALVTAEGCRGRIDTALIELQKYKEGVHGEMQRFYGIMRRNEKAALGAVAQAPGDAGSEIPDEIAVTSLRKDEQESEKLSKQELRRMAREAGL